MSRAKKKYRLIDPATLDQEHLVTAPETEFQAKLAYRRRVREASRRMYAPRPKERVWEWAEKFFYLEGGLYRQSTVEVSRGPLSAPTEEGVREIVAMGPTQLFKTTLLEVTNAYFMHRQPTLQLMVQPKDELARKFSRDKIGPNIARSPALRQLVRPMLGREGDSTILFKAHPGGSTVISSAGSPANFAMSRYEVIALDEVDKYEDTVEGDVAALARKRMTLYPYTSLFLQSCSPTNQKSRIAKAYEASDQRKPALPCPHCDHIQTLEWGAEDTKHGVKWHSTGEGSMKQHFPETASYSCISCGVMWTDTERRGALRHVRWYQTRPVLDDNGDALHPVDHLNDPKRWWWDEWGQINRFIDPQTGRKLIDNRVAGFWASNLYSPWKSMADLVRVFVTDKDNPATLQVFINTDLALTFSDAGEEVDPHTLRNRRIAIDYVPDQAHVTFMTADTQDDRIEVARWAANLVTEQLWLIDHQQLWGNTAQEEPWAALEALHKERLPRRDGFQMPITALLLDVAGHRRDVATRWVNKRKGRNAIAIVGKAEPGGQRSDIFPQVASYKNRQKMAVWPLSVNAAKDVLSSRLNITDPTRNGYIAISDRIGDEFIDQMGSEKAVPALKNGRWVRIWTPKAKRNEGWDLCVYAIAALRFYVQLPGPSLKALLAPPAKLVSEPVAAPVAPATPATVPVAPEPQKSVPQPPVGGASSVPKPQTQSKGTGPKPGTVTAKRLHVPRSLTRRR